MKVLLLAYECSPYRGSEWGVGWGRLLQAARAAEIHVITAHANLADLDRARADGLLPAAAHIHAPPESPQLRRRLQHRLASDYNYRAYRQWHRRAFDLAQALHARHTFDLVHQSTVCTFREPGDGWRLGIPFLWGPFGGTQNFPLRMLSMLPPQHAAYEAARALANRLTLRFHPRVRAAATHAAALLAANSTNAADISRALQRPVRQLLETGLTAVPTPDRHRFHARLHAFQQGHALPPLRLLWSGQLRPRKALPILLRALAELRGTVDLTLDILGDGPERIRWQRQAARLGLAQAVTFRGRLSLPQAVAAMADADLFCFTSLRDTSGNVVLEALAAGVPVLAFHHQGAADMVTGSCGIPIPVTTPPIAATAWAHAIRCLASDPARLLQLSEGATAQAKQFLWSSNGDRVNALYRQLARPTLQPGVPGVLNPTPEPAW